MSKKAKFSKTYAFTHRNLPNLKSLSELFKMYMKSLDSFI